MGDKSKQSDIGKYALWLVLLLVLGFIGFAAMQTWLEALAAVDYSAHAALNKEIQDQLAAIPPGEPYPASLSDLELSYPDGGDEGLLKRFDYQSNGASCTVKTVLGGKTIERSFP
jgi:hypothetical protein